MTRRIAACALLVALASCGAGGSSTSGSPPPRRTPDYGVLEWSAEPDGSNNCGDFAVGWESPDVGGEGPTATLHAINGGDVVLDLKGRDEFEQLTALWCGNVAGDGRMELATQRYTGGAHCCFAIRVDTLDGPTLLERDLGNYGGLEAKDLDDRDGDELVGSSDVLAYFGDLSYAATAPVPLVFAFRNGRYIEATADYPDLVREKLAGAVKDLRAVLDDGFEDAIKGMAIGVYAHHVLLGDEDAALTELEQQVPAAVASWLREHAGEAAKLVRGEATPAPK
jgi:hypothetical protein